MLAHPLNLFCKTILVIIGHVIVLKWRLERRLVITLETNESSSAIVIIDLSDDEVIEYCESFRSTSHYPLSANLSDNEHENSDVSERTNDPQNSSCSSDEEGVDNAQGDVNIQVNAPNAQEKLSFFAYGLGLPRKKSWRI